MAAAPPPLERAFGITNIKTRVPFLLDADEADYDAWRELFLTHWQSFDVSGHLDGTLLPANDDDAAWKKRDGLVKLWIYGTLAKDLFKSTFKTGGTSREVWLRLENFFRDKKKARAVQLNHKLRTQEIGDLSIHAYCQELKSIADLMANVDAPVSEKTLVTYLLNGLNEKYDNIINVIKHRQAFPTLEQARSMLILEEERLGKPKKVPSHKDESSSSPKVLAAVSTTEQKATQQSNQPRQFQNRGNRGNGRRGRGRNNNFQPRPQFNNWNNPFWQQGYPMWPQQQFNPWKQMPLSPHPQPGLLGSRPQQQMLVQGTHNNNSNQPQPTMDFASAFNTMTLIDPTDSQWYMDSGATAHLSNTAGNLKSVINTSTGKIVTVANRGKVPISSSGACTFQTQSRPLSLHSVLVTPSIIKNLISVLSFTKDNSCSVEFDPMGFSVKDLQTRRTLSPQ